MIKSKFSIALLCIILIFSLTPDLRSEDFGIRTQPPQGPQARSGGGLPGGLPQLVFDTASLKQAVQSYDALKAQVEHGKAMSLDIHKMLEGEISPQFLNTLANEAYRCGFERMDIGDIAQYMPTLPDNICGGHGILAAFKKNSRKYFGDPDMNSAECKSNPRQCRAQVRLAKKNREMEHRNKILFMKTSSEVGLAQVEKTLKVVNELEKQDPATPFESQKLLLKTNMLLLKQTVLLNKSINQLTSLLAAEQQRVYGIRAKTEKLQKP